MTYDQKTRDKTTKNLEQESERRTKERKNNGQEMENTELLPKTF